MAGFFKKLFMDGGSSTGEKDQSDILEGLVNEIIAEEEIQVSEASGKTNKLPQIQERTAAEEYNGFSRYKFSSASHIGRVKRSNQDSIFTGDFKCHTNDGVLTVGLGIVADGMGGLSMGEIASITAISAVTAFMYTRISEYFQNGFPDCETILTHISNSIQNANAMVKEKGDAAGEEIGTTFTMVMLIGSTAYFGHVGDSRAYITDLKRGSMEKITRDHSLVGRMIEMGQLTENEAKSHPRRNEIYRMLGVRDAIEVDTYTRTIDENSVITLVSDGVWEFVDDDIIHQIICNRSLTEAAEALIREANDNGGGDNISAVLINPVSDGPQRKAKE